MSQYCYWEIKTDIDFYCAEFLALLSLLITIYIFYTTYKLFKFHKTIDFKVKVIYIHLCLWGIFHVTKLLMGEIGYAFYLKNEPHNVENQQKFSYIFCVIDSISTIILQGVLLLIPYIWTANITKFLNVSAGKILRKTQVILKLLYFYMWVRFPVYIIFFGLQLLKQHQYWCEVINNFIISEAVLCVVVLLFGSKTLLSNFQLLNLNGERDRLKLKRQFTFLMIFCCIRLLLNVVFILLSFLDIAFNTQKCINPQQIFVSYVHSVVYLVIGILFTHQFPVMLILHIYNINTQKKYKSEKKSSLTFSFLD